MPLCPQITNTPITVVQNSDFTVTSVVPAVASTYDGLAQEIDSIVVDIDGKTKAYYQATPPTGASEGDIWFDTDEGNKQYFYNGTAWVSVQDAAIAAAQATADGKNRIYRQASQPTGGTYVEGDLWFDTDDGNKIYRYTSGSWANAVELGNSAISSLSASKLTAGTIDASVITVSNINAGNISTGTLNADRIGATSITGAKIAGSTITTDKLIAGNLTGYTINNGNGTFSVSSAGVVTASSGTIGGWSISGLGLSVTNGTVTTSLQSNGFLNVYDSSNTPTGAAYFIARDQIANAAYGPYGFSVTAFAAFDCRNELGGYSGIPRVYAGANRSIRLVPHAGLISNSYPVLVEGTLETYGRIQCAGNINAPNIPSTTSAANVRWTTGGVGQFQYVTSSSERFKDNITDIVNVPGLEPKALLSLPVRAFTYRPEHLSEDDDRFDVMIPGFIAEEVDSVYPIATDYDENGPVSWNDRLMIPGLLALIQDLYKEIAQLKGE